jgi:Truncated hemoglobins
MNPEQRTLYDRINGDKIMPKLVEIFYKKVMEDKEIAPFFENIDMERQHEHQRRFLSVNNLIVVIMCLVYSWRDP